VQSTGGRGRKASAPGTTVRAGLKAEDSNAISGRLEGRSKGVGIAAFNGTPAILGNIQSKNFVTMDVSESAP
jgi:hypothetical protein